MAYQQQSNGYCAYKVQSALNSQASGSGAKIFRTTGGAGGKMTTDDIENEEVRRDGMRSRGRQGIQKTQGTQSGHLSLATYDDVIEAIMRDTWSSADLAITEATTLGGSAAITSITTTTSTIVGSAGSWILQGLRVGDIIRLTGHSSAGNNSRNLRIIGLTATVITVAETLTANAVADTSFTVTRPGRKLIQYSAGVLVPRYFTWEENEIDIDGSELFTDTVFGNVKLSGQPDGNINFEAGWWGTGQFETKTGASAPFFSSPTETTSIPLTFTDATIRLGTQDLVELTSFDITLDLAPNVPKTGGTRGIKYSPDVFLGQMGVSLNLTMLRKDLAYVANHINEDQLSLHLMFEENEAQPSDFVSLYIGNFTLGNVDKSALNRAGGPKTQTLNVPMARVGKDDQGGAFDATMIKFQRSNAA